MDNAADTEAPQPILSKPPPICEEIEESSDSEGFPPGFEPVAQAGPTEIEDLADIGGTETRQEPRDHGSLFSGAADTVWAGPAIPGNPGAAHGTFMGLLALADANAVPDGSFLCFPDSYFWRAPSGDAPWTGGSYTAPNTSGLVDLPRHTYDLNLPAETVEDAVSEASIPQFAPITPNKSLGVDYQPTTEDQLIKEGDELRRPMLEEAIPGKEIVVDLTSTDSPSASSKNTENLNIQKVDEEHGGIDAIKTPQQKPRRKKHRPKVVREGKPKQTPKPKTPPKSVVVEGEKRVRKKNVQRKGADGSPEEIIGESVDPKPVNLPKKSCKRVLNFDSEEQPPTNLAAPPNAQTEPAVQMNSTDNFSQEFEDYVKQTEIARLKEKTNFSLSVMIGGGQATEQNNHYVRGGEIQNQVMNMSGIKYNSLQAYESLPCMQNVQKRKRSDDVHVSSSSILTSSTSAEASTKSSSDPRLDFRFASIDTSSSVTEVQEKRQDMGCMFAFSQSERSTNKGSQAHSCVGDLTKFAQYHMMSNGEPHKQGANSMNPRTLEEIQTPSRKKRTKRLKDILLMHHKQHRSLLQSRVGKPRRLWRKLLSVEAITEQLENLNINRENSRNKIREMNAIVPYRYNNHGVEGNNKMMVLFQRDGTIVPFNPVKLRKPRPKVDLDDETTRVWKLLLEDINSEGIDGTDEEKAKWWEEERRVFRGRADSFIARMHLVQGDRRFSPWKGSVVDSVVGVFLTQNVSDHLSSSAFMSLVARYPPNFKQKQSSDEGTSSLINDPDVSILDLEYTSKWREKMPSPTVSISVNETETNEEVEMITIEEFSTSTTKRVSSTSDVVGSETDAVSFQDSVISSQNSSDCMKAPTAERRGSSSENSEIEDPTERCGFLKTSSPFTSSTSFMQLLHMAGSSIPSEFHIHEHGDVSSNESLKIDPESSKHCKERQNTVPNTANSMLEDECSQQSRGEAKSSDSSKIDCSNSNCSRDNVASEGNKKEGERIMNQHPLAREADIVKTGNSRPKGKSTGKEKVKFDWDSLRKEAETRCGKKGRTPNTTDSVDWERIRSSEVEEIADAIRDRGMNNVLAGRIQDFLNRLLKEHGSLDLEWLRDVPPDKAKEFLLSIRGLGLKSVECVRLLTLHHLAFPVDTNVGRIAVRLGWVPLQPLPESLQLHLLELYPVMESIQKFLWPRLCKLDQRTLYELHYQMITFGKVFCTKSKPNCNACPMRGECRHFASAFASARLALPEPEVKSIVGTSSENTMPSQNNPEPLHPLPLPEGSTIPYPNNPETVQFSLPPTEENGINRLGNSELLHLQQLLEEARPGPSNCQPIIEEPASPQHEGTQMADYDETDIEDFGEIPTIRLNMEEFTQNLQNYMQQNMELQEGDMSKALVALTPEAASIPVPKLKNVSRLRTEHLVYDLPDDHPLLDGLDKREPDDPGRYLLAIWTPGETATSVQPPEKKCNSQEHGTLCNDSACFSCHSIREANSQTVRGTILIPCRTAMRGSFPLNGTYFQVNEVFADHESSLQPIDVPRDWLWKLQRRTVYFGTSIPSIFKGLTTEGIQHCFWRGYVCVRGFDRNSRAPRPLMARLHFPASKLSKGRGNMDEG